MVQVRPPTHMLIRMSCSMLLPYCYVSRSAGRASIHGRTAATTATTAPASGRILHVPLTALHRISTLALRFDVVKVREPEHELVLIRARGVKRTVPISQMKVTGRIGSGGNGTVRS